MLAERDLSVRSLGANALSVFDEATLSERPRKADLDTFLVLEAQQANELDNFPRCGNIVLSSSRGRTSFMH